MRVGRSSHAGSVVAALMMLVLGAAGAMVGAGSALATHDSPPVRTVTYDVQQRGSVSTDLETFAAHAAATFADVRGWSLGGPLAYERVASDAELTLWLAEASTLPSFSSVCSTAYSCRAGRDVVINETRWRTATASWTRSLDDYQHYVVNHELGHWLGEGHVSCPGAGQAAPVMQQQSKSLQGCVATVWPLPGERVSVAARLGTEVRPDLFSDIGGTVHAEAVRDGADAAVVAGFPDGTYRPAEAVTRGQMASLVARARGLPPGGTSDFTDIAGSIHADGIRTVADAGIASGFPDGTFRPHSPVVRAQMAAFLARALGLDTTDESCAPPDTAGSTHAGAVCAALRAGVALGRDDGGFAPTEVVDRGQMSSFLVRAFLERAQQPAAEPDGD